ncbi:MAG TPA: hypothetical protein GX726_03135 [Clostridiales bacterium]|jgi:transcriptional regulator with XRE-family HTH domain|nr:hypothetical protein [Clostridiales bacterium]
MTYAEMLSEMINASELSLRQIARRCQDLNLSITPSYISQLKNGKLPPPSEEVSLTLAKACGSNKQAFLVFQGYMEKAPKLIREYMLASSTLNKAMMESLCRMTNQEFDDDMKQYIDSLDILSAMDLSSKYLNEDGFKADDLVRQIVLSCGGATEADTTGELLHMFLGDSSMSPTIPVHSMVYVMPTKLELLKTGDIIMFYPDNRRIPTLRRIHYVKERIILIPDEKSHETFLFDDVEELNYVGKVVSFKVDL